MDNYRSFRERLKRDIARQWRSSKEHKVLYLFLLPFFTVFFTFTIFPIVVSLVFSFTDFNALEPPSFVGLSNYIRLFLHDSLFITAIRNTLIFSIVTGPIGFLMALLFAWLINEMNRGLRIVLTILFFAPSLVGGMGAMWGIIFSSDAAGFANALLISLDLIGEPIRFLRDPAWIAPIVIVVVLWASLGTSFLVFIAGLQGVDRQYYEAGAIDGINNRWQELWFITLPLMRPQLLLGAVLSITSSFGIGDVITQLAGFPTTDYAAHTITTHMQDFGNVRFEMGYASAIATILFIIMIACNKGVRKLIGKVGS